MDPQNAPKAFECPKHGHFNQTAIFKNHRIYDELGHRRIFQRSYDIKEKSHENPDHTVNSVQEKPNSKQPLINFSPQNQILQPKNLM